MIYEINGKPHVKVENFYAEVEVLKDKMVPAKNFIKIYADEIDESEVKKYNSMQEYKENLHNNFDFDLDLNRPKRNKIK